MLVEQIPPRKWKLAFWPVAFCPHWRFGQWHTVHCHYVHWHFSIGISSGHISGIGIFGYGVLVIGISAVAFFPDTGNDHAPRPCSTRPAYITCLSCLAISFSRSGLPQ